MWTDEDTEKLLVAWKLANDEYGGNDAVCTHFRSQSADGAVVRSAETVITQRQAMRAMAKFITDYSSLKPAGGRTSTGENWFALSHVEQVAAHRLASSVTYPFVDFDQASYARIVELETDLKKHTVNFPTPWSREELAALVRAWVNMIKGPTPRRTRSGASGEVALLYKRFVSGMKRGSRRGAYAVAKKLEALKNSVAVIREFDRENNVTCTSCRRKTGWFSLTTAQRKAEFEVHSKTAHRMVEVDEPLYAVAEAALLRSGDDDPQAPTRGENTTHPALTCVGEERRDAADAAGDTAAQQEATASVAEDECEEVPSAAAQNREVESMHEQVEELKEAEEMQGTVYVCGRKRDRDEIAELRDQLHSLDERLEVEYGARNMLEAEVKRLEQLAGAEREEIVTLTHQTFEAEKRNQSQISQLQSSVQAWSDTIWRHTRSVHDAELSALLEQQRQLNEARERYRVESARLEERVLAARMHQEALRGPAPMDASSASN